MSDRLCATCRGPIRPACRGQLAGICDADHSRLLVVSDEFVRAADALSKITETGEDMAIAKARIAYRAAKERS